MHAPTFILANVILDVEPLVIMLFRLPYSLHGYFHTLLAAFAVWLLLGLALFKIEKHMQPTYKLLMLETDRTYNLKSFLLAGVFGAAMHVLLDAFLYSDVNLLFPSAGNPLLYAGISGSAVFAFCVWMGIAGLAFYAILMAFTFHRRLSNGKR